MKGKKNEEMVENEEIKDEQSGFEMSGAEESKALSQQQIDEWKKEYGKIFQTVIGSSLFIWRRIRRKEYVDSMTDTNLSDDPDRRIYERQESIMKKVVLYPAPDVLETLIDEEGCLATCLGSEIMDRSGFAMPLTSQLN